MREIRELIDEKANETSGFDNIKDDKGNGNNNQNGHGMGNEQK